MLTTAILGALVSFGTYTENVGYNPRFVGNTVTINTYYDLNKYSVGEVYHFHDNITYLVDFEKNGDGEFTAYVDECIVRTYLVDNANNNTESLITSSTTFYDPDNLGSSGIPLKFNDDTRFIEVYYTGVGVSNNNFTYSMRTFWSDNNLDTGVGIIENCSFTVSSTVYGVDRHNGYKVDMNSIYNQVNGAFISQSNGYYDGYNNGYATGNADGYSTGYGVGYSDGYSEGVSSESTAFTIFNGILNIGMIPINFFLAMFDFTILGINVSNFVMSILSVYVTIWLIRLLTGKKTDGN